MEHSRFHQAQVAHPAYFLAGAPVGRVVALVVTDHEHAAAAAGRARDLLGLREAEAHGLLHEDVLVGLQGPQGRFAVRARGRDEDGLHVLPDEQLPVVRGAHRYPVARAHRVEHRAVHVGEARDAEEVGTLGEVGQMHHLGDSARAHHRHAQGGAHRPVLSRR